MNCERWSHHDDVIFFVTGQKQEDKEVDDLWQIIRSLLGDGVAEAILQPSQKN